MQEKNYNKEQEARNFIGKKGPAYVVSASTQEKDYFDGIIYKNGILNYNLLYPNYSILPFQG